MSNAGVLFLAAGLGLLLAIVLFIISDVTMNGELSFIAFIVGIISVVTIFVALLVNGHEAEAARAKTDKLVEKVCYPRVVTNRSEGDGFVFFDCANDHRLRKVKRVKP